MTRTKNTSKTRTVKTATKTAAPSKRETVDAIETLIADLAAESNQNAKKKIRAKLRRLGHYGASRTATRPIISKSDAAALVAAKPVTA